MMTLISGNPSMDFVYRHTINEKEFVLDTREVKQILGQEADFSCPEIVLWLREYIKEGIQSLK